VFLIECPKGNNGGKNVVDYWVPADREKAVSKVCHRLREKRKETRSIAPRVEGGDRSLKGKEPDLGSEALKEETLPDESTTLSANHSHKHSDNTEHTQSTASDSRQQKINDSISIASPRLGHRVSNSDNESYLSPIDSREESILNSDSAVQSTVSPIEANDDILQAFAQSEFIPINTNDRGNNSEACNNSINVVGTTTSMSFREWITNEIKAVDTTILQNESQYLPYYDNTTPLSFQARTFVASSKCYIKKALHIAHSLANQICNGEQTLESNYQRRNSDFLPWPGYDWANRIIIHVQTNLNVHSSSESESLTTTAW